MATPLAPAASIDERLEIQEGVCAITHAALDVDEIIRLVGDGGAGGTAVFIGTTRNSFKGAFVPAKYNKYLIRSVSTFREGRDKARVPSVQ